MFGVATVRDELLRHTAALIVATVTATIVALGASNLWFFSDAWPILADRELTTLEGWVKPHGGHWLVAPTVVAKFTHFFVGMDFYPWYYLPRAVLYGALALGWWVVMDRRGVKPAVSFSALLLISWLGTSGWMITVVYIGPIVVGLCALVVATVLDRDEGDHRANLILFVTLMIALTSSADGPAVWAAAAMVIVLRRRFTTYAPAIVPAGIVYALWYLIVVRRDPSPLTPEPPSLSDIVGAPLKMLRLIGQGLTEPLFLPDSWELPAAFALLVVIVGAWHRRRVRVFDWVILLTGIIIVALGVLIRGAQGIRIDAPNRIYLVAAYLLIGLFPILLPMVRRVPTQAAVAAMFTILAIANFGLLDDEIDARERYMQVARERVETAAALLHQGEQLIPWTGVSPQANNRNLAVLVNDGWSGHVTPELLIEIRSETQAAGFPATSPFGMPLGIDAEVDGDGCSVISGQSTTALELAGNGAVLVVGATDATITFSRPAPNELSTEIPVPRSPYGIAYATGSQPGAATLSVDAPADSLLAICGVSAMGK